MSALPYGTWPSRLRAADLTAGRASIGDLTTDGPRLLWTESRPSEGGRQAPVVWDADGGMRDVGPPDWNARTRVHEYGGAPMAARDGAVFVSRFDDQRLYRLDVDGHDQPTPVTPDPSQPAGERYADGEVTPDGRWLVCVRESHEGPGAEPRNEIVAIDLAESSIRVLVPGRDFVAAPRVSRDGRRLAWLAWDHPYMPWDAAELWVADLGGGELAAAAHVRGGPGDAANAPVWDGDGGLLASFDGSGFWEVHRWDGSGPHRLTDFGADVGFPHWQFGNSALAVLTDGRVACVVIERAVARLELLTPETGHTERLDLPYVGMNRLRRFRDGLAFVGSRVDGTNAVVVWTPADGADEVRTVPVPRLTPGDVPAPEEVTVDLPDGARTHAFLYPPANAEVTGPADERPPLIVFTHGGPTGHVTPAVDGQIAYWTTRGFAVADVNYRGSTGYGRAYRDSLLGQWGVHDVTDAIAVARSLADRGAVDGARMAIRGGSAGGFTTLAVLTSDGHPFACGTSFFGVADLEALARHTHKFESRYLDQVVGPLPDAAERYRERSPIHRVDRLARPILVLQGLEDAVVPPEQSEAIVAAAAERGIPHAYLAFEGEQHGFRRAETIITWMESELAFYGQVMGFVPAGDLPHLDLSPAPYRPRP